MSCCSKYQCFADLGYGKACRCPSPTGCPTERASRRFLHNTLHLPQGSLSDGTWHFLYFRRTSLSRDLVCTARAGCFSPLTGCQTERASLFLHKSASKSLEIQSQRGTSSFIYVSGVPVFHGPGVNSKAGWCSPVTGCQTQRRPSFPYKLTFKSLCI
jgi:hypothetical protein